MVLAALSVLAVAGLLMRDISAFSSGMVFPACDTMVPQHSEVAAQTTPAPFKLDTVVNSDGTIKGEE